MSLLESVVIYFQFIEFFCRVIEYLSNTKLALFTDVCGKNEIFSLAIKTECQNTCEDPTKSKTCVSDKVGNGCICKRGFFRNSKNQCVPPRECGNLKFTK